MYPLTDYCNYNYFNTYVSLHTGVNTDLPTTIIILEYSEFNYIFTFTSEFHTFICFPVSNQWPLISAEEFLLTLLVRLAWWWWNSSACQFGEPFICSSVLKDTFTRYKCSRLVVFCFLFPPTCWMYHPTSFWPAKLLLKIHGPSYGAPLYVTSCFSLTRSSLARGSRCVSVRVSYSVFIVTLWASWIWVSVSTALVRLWPLFFLISFLPLSLSSPRWGPCDSYIGQPDGVL